MSVLASGELRGLNQCPSLSELRAAWKIDNGGSTESPIFGLPTIYLPQVWSSEFTYQVPIMALFTPVLGLALNYFQKRQAWTIMLREVPQKYPEFPASLEGRGAASGA